MATQDQADGVVLSWETLVLCSALLPESSWNQVGCMGVNMHWGVTVREVDRTNKARGTLLFEGVCTCRPAAGRRLPPCTGHGLLLSWSCCLLQVLI